MMTVVVVMMIVMMVMMIHILSSFNELLRVIGVSVHSYT